jgi:DNA-binding response OmpR family regulator
VRGVELLVLSADPDPASVLPALGLLSHSVRYGPAAVSELSNLVHSDAILLDARAAPGPARMMCRLLGATTVGTPVLAVLSEAGWPEVSGQWGVADVLASSAGPAEVSARLRLAVGRGGNALAATPKSGSWMLGGLEIDEPAHAARIYGRDMELTYREFGLLAHLARHPGRVFTREQLLAQVWGHDFLGGTRTVDVHIRRVRAKLGHRHHRLIATIRNVGYRFVDPHDRAPPAPATAKHPHQVGVRMPGPVHRRQLRTESARPQRPRLVTSSAAGPSQTDR